MRFDICLEMVFMNLPFEERIEKAAKAGFSIGEFWFHDATFDGSTCTTNWAKDPKAINDACKANNFTINNMVVNASDGSFGGSPVDKADRNKYLERLHEVIEFSKAINVNMAITCTGNNVPNLDCKQMMDNLHETYGLAAEIAASKNFTLVLEPLNTHVDHEGYFLNNTMMASSLVRTVNNPSFRLLYDVYHMQIMEGNVISNITRLIDIIGHFHSAGVPGRHEHYGTELNYPEIIKRIEALGYKGCFGLEYAPAMEDNIESLKSVLAYLKG